MPLRESERQLLEQQAEAAEAAYERAWQDLQDALPRVRGAGERRVRYTAHVEQARELGAQLQRLYDLLNEDDQAWSKLPK
jgi:hypothetical protein